MTEETLEIRMIREGDWDALFRRLHAGTLRGAQHRRAVLNRELRGLGEFATAQQRVYAPHGDSGYLHAHIGMSERRWRPGGAGGGGAYEYISGVRRGTSLHPLYVHEGTANPSDDPRGIDDLVSAGHLQGASLQGRIYPKGLRGDATVIATTNVKRVYERIDPRKRATFFDASAPGTSVLRRPALTFQKRGEPRKFKAWVTGQRPQPFVYWSFVHTAVYAKGRLRTIAWHLI